MDGNEGEKNNVFDIYTYGGKENQRNEYILDFRKSVLFEEEYIEIINKSGHNIILIGLNDWQATLRTSEAIIVREGVMEYMSQYEI